MRKTGPLSNLAITRRGLLAGSAALAGLAALTALTPLPAAAQDTPVSGGVLKVAFSADRPASTRRLGLRACRMW